MSPELQLKQFCCPLESTVSPQGTSVHTAPCARDTLPRWSPESLTAPVGHSQAFPVLQASVSICIKEGLAGLEELEALS